MAYGMSQNQFLYQPPDPLSEWPKALTLANAQIDCTQFQEKALACQLFASFFYFSLSLFFLYLKMKVSKSSPNTKEAELLCRDANPWACTIIQMHSHWEEGS